AIIAQAPRLAPLPVGKGADFSEGYGAVASDSRWADSSSLDFLDEDAVAFLADDFDLGVGVDKAADADDITVFAIDLGLSNGAEGSGGPAARADEGAMFVFDSQLGLVVQF